MAKEEDCDERREFQGEIAVEGRSNWVLNPIPF
jgi:hypothetical protein